MMLLNKVYKLFKRVIICGKNVKILSKCSVFGFNIYWKNIKSKFVFILENR